MPHPSRPSTRRFQTTAALSDTAVWVCFLASLLCSATCRLLACATVWICLFVLVLPSRPLPSGARFCPSCGLLPRPPKFDADTRCLNYLFYTPRNRGVHLPEKKREPRSIRSPLRSTVLRAATHWKPGLRTGHMVVWRSFACSRHSREYPLDRITLWEKRWRTGRQFAD